MAPAQPPPAPPFDETAPALDRVFGLPYWLQTTCLGRTMWAANPEHLANLKQMISTFARPKTPGFGLPHWMTAERNRSYVLRGLAVLERRATMAGQA